LAENKRDNGSIELIKTDEPVDILDVQYLPEEEVEKKDRGLIRFPEWVEEYQELIGALIVAAVEIALKFL